MQRAQRVVPAEGGVLFEARWIHRSPSRAATEPPSGWSVVRRPDRLAAWTARHDTADVLLPGLLDRSGFSVLAREVDGALTGGAVAHLLGGVVGVSNVWSDTDLGQHWAELVAAVAARHPGRALVGYERGEDLPAALAAGFSDVGPKIVWAR